MPVPVFVMLPEFEMTPENVVSELLIENPRPPVPKATVPSKIKSPVPPVFRFVAEPANAIELEIVRVVLSVL